MLRFMQEEIRKTRDILQHIEEDTAFLENIQTISMECVRVLRANGKILFAGNGGSAADSQHLSAELVSRLRYDRPGLASMAFTTDTSALTAIGNDYSFENLFSRQVESIGQKGDLLIGISTSGKSPNILKAFAAARKKELITVGLTGAVAPLMSASCDYMIHVPSRETAKIQECHILLGHIICSLIEEEMFGADYNPLRQKEKELAGA